MSTDSPNSDAPVKPPERRTGHRHGVDTSATIYLIKIGSKMRGQILDLSLGGCRIRTNDRFPVGIYTRVETEFRLHGQAVLLGGVVQAVHDRDQVGIRFLDVSQRKRDQLVALIEELGEASGRKEATTEAPSEDYINSAGDAGPADVAAHDRDRSSTDPSRAPGA
jgi:c-di-GMP-binding flagellar brake protein YcgR